MSEWRANVNAVERAVDHYPALKLLHAMADRIEFLEASLDRKVKPDGLDAQSVADWLEEHEVKPLPWQSERLRKLGAR